MGEREKGRHGDGETRRRRDREKRLGETEKGRQGEKSLIIKGKAKRSFKLRAPGIFLTLQASHFQTRE